MSYFPIKSTFFDEDVDQDQMHILGSDVQHKYSHKLMRNVELVKKELVENLIDKFELPKPDDLNNFDSSHFLFPSVIICNLVKEYVTANINEELIELLQFVSLSIVQKFNRLSEAELVPLGCFWLDNFNEIKLFRYRLTEFMTQTDDVSTFLNSTKSGIILKTLRLCNKIFSQTCSDIGRIWIQRVYLCLKNMVVPERFLLEAMPDMAEKFDDFMDFLFVSQYDSSLEELIKFIENLYWTCIGLRVVEPARNQILMLVFQYFDTLCFNTIANMPNLMLKTKYICFDYNMNRIENSLSHIVIPSFEKFPKLWELQKVLVVSPDDNIKLETNSNLQNQSRDFKINLIASAYKFGTLGKRVLRRFYDEMFKTANNTTVTLGQVEQAEIITCDPFQLLSKSNRVDLLNLFLPVDLNIPMIKNIILLSSSSIHLHESNLGGKKNEKTSIQLINFSSCPFIDINQNQFYNEAFFREKFLSM